MVLTDKTVNRILRRWPAREVVAAISVQELYWRVERAGLIGGFAALSRSSDTSSSRSTRIFTSSIISGRTQFATLRVLSGERPHLSVATLYPKFRRRCIRLTLYERMSRFRITRPSQDYSAARRHDHVSEERPDSRPARNGRGVAQARPGSTFCTSRRSGHRPRYVSSEASR